MWTQSVSSLWLKAQSVLSALGAKCSKKVKPSLTTQKERLKGSLVSLSKLKSKLLGFGQKSLGWLRGRKDSGQTSRVNLLIQNLRQFDQAHKQLKQYHKQSLWRKRQIENAKARSQS